MNTIIHHDVKDTFQLWVSCFFLLKLLNSYENSTAELVCPLPGTFAESSRTMSPPVFSVVDRISGHFHTLLLAMPAYYPDCEIITRKMRLFNRKIAKTTQRYPATPKNSFGHARLPHYPIGLVLTEPAQLCLFFANNHDILIIPIT